MNQKHYYKKYEALERIEHCRSSSSQLYRLVSIVVRMDTIRYDYIILRSKTDEETA